MLYKAVVPGTFDPFTYGHMWVVSQALKMASSVTVLIGASEKVPMATARARQLLIQEVFAEMNDPMDHPGGKHATTVVTCEIVPVGATVVQVADDLKASLIVRGIRTAPEYEHEHTLATINRELAPHITTVLVPTPDMLRSVSSSNVRALMAVAKSNPAAVMLIEKMVPLPVFEMIRRRILKSSC